MTDEQVYGGRYRIEAPIGDGGMARVYRAGDMRLGRTVALKLLREQFTHEQEFVDRFRQEARLAANLAHPTIVGVYDVGEDHDRHYIVMEYVEGENLKQLLAREAPLALDVAAGFMRQLGAALDYAHEHGVIHRDIKPENILITRRREVKVGDFGIARALANVGMTTTGTVLGSVSYFSPEQASGQPATAESDLYSAGMVLYEMLTGQVPFAGPNPVAVAMAQVNDQPPSPRTFRPELPPAVETVVLKAIAKRPADRYHSGQELTNALLDATQRNAPRAVAATVAPAFAPTIPNTPLGVMSAVPQRPQRTGTGGALAALITTAVLLIAAVLVGRNLTSGSAGGAGTPTDTPVTSSTQFTGAAGAGGTGTPAASATPRAATGTTSGNGIVSAAPTATPSTNAAPTSAPPTALTISSSTPLATSTPLGAATVAPSATSVVPTTQPTAKPVTGSVGGATVELVTAHGVDSNYNPVNPATTFSTKTKVVDAVAQLHHKPPRSTVVFTWHYPDGSSYKYLDYYVTGYAGDVTAYAELFPRGSGTYSVTVSLNGHRLASQAFTIVAGSAASVAPPSANVAAPVSASHAVPVTSKKGNGKHKGNGNGNDNGNSGNGGGD